MTAHALANALSLECWGGATFDVSLRFLHECPWCALAAPCCVQNNPFLGISALPAAMLFSTRATRGHPNCVIAAHVAGVG